MWFRKAAFLDHAQAACDLAQMYSDGHGGEQNAQTAAFWFQVAAGLGNAKAMKALSQAYRDGHGVERDEQKANLWQQKAAALPAVTPGPVKAGDP